MNGVEANSRRRQVHEYLVTSFVLSCLWLLQIERKKTFEGDYLEFTNKMGVEFCSFNSRLNVDSTVDELLGFF